MPPEPGPEMWRFLLAARQEVTWGNFAWFSPKTLLLSINDQIAKRIEPPDTTGSIVDRRRMRWMAHQATRPGVAMPDVPLRIPEARGALLLGDPGEMDASQYVLVRDLAGHQQTLLDADVRVALLMSDVIYPVGDINAWADAVYLPYLGQPGEVWSAATGAWTKATATADTPKPPFARDWHLLAMPGNHDWYDGLNGFMFHAAGAEALPEVGYDTEGLTFRERLAAALWRKPAPPQRERFALHRSKTRAPGLGNLPGPYYAVDLGCSVATDAVTGHIPVHAHDEGCAQLRLVMVDNGITGTIDVEQAAWLRRIVKTRDGLPVIVVTGIPVAVNNKLNWLRVADPDLDDRAVAGDREVLSILRGAGNVIATVAGDIHNYQRIDFSGQESSMSAYGRGLPLLQIVSGGAGAFLSATHPTVLDTDGALTVTHVHQREVSTEGASVRVPAGDHVRFPSREGSLAHFARWTSTYLGGLLLLLAADLVGLVAGTVALRDLHAGYTRADRGWLVGGPWVLLVGIVVLAGLLASLLDRLRRASQPEPLPFGDWIRRGVIAVAVCCLIAATYAVAARFEPRGLLWWLLGLLFVLALMLAQFVPYLARAFPWVRRSLLVWLVAAFVVFRVGQGSDREWQLLHLAELAVATSVVVVLGRLAHRSLTVFFTRQSFLSSRARWALLPLNAAPWATVSLVLLVVCVVVPDSLLDVLGVGSPELVAQVGRALYWVTLSVVCTGLAAFATLSPLSKARTAVPRTMWVATAVTTVAIAVVAGVLVSVGDAGTWAAWRWAVVLLALLVGPAVTVVAWLAPHLLRPPAPDPAELRGFLARRDGGQDASGRSRATVAAALVGALPGLESLAEASQPPFAKNVVLVEVEDDGVHFRAYGLNNESPSSATLTTLPTSPPTETDGPGPERGFFLLDHVCVDLGTRTVDVLATWSALEHHVP